MCNLCNNIKEKEQYEKMRFWDRATTIVQQQNKAFGLWVECADSYSSRIAMEINYCPICGRKLNGE